MNNTAAIFLFIYSQYIMITLEREEIFADSILFFVQRNFTIGQFTNLLHDNVIHYEKTIII